jgi:hypothetical protein
MKVWPVVIVAAIVILIGAISCDRINQEVDNSQVSELKGIPAEYGALISVTTIPDYPNWFQLWFQDEAGTIRMVRIQIFSGVMHQDVKVLPRI